MGQKTSGRRASASSEGRRRRNRPTGTLRGRWKRWKNPLQRLVESKAIRRATFAEYRSEIRQHYDGPAGAMLKFGSMVSLHEPLSGMLLRKRIFDVSGRRRILDVGSGAAQVLRHLLRYADTDAQIYCMDISLQMLRRARARVRSTRPRTIACDVTRLPFADDSFDCITCGWVLEHLPDPRPGLAELARVLTPDGNLLILATEDTLPGAVTSRTWKCRTYSRREMRAACYEAGLVWNRQLWFTRVHRLLRLGGILVEASKKSA